LIGEYRTTNDMKRFLLLLSLLSTLSLAASTHAAVLLDDTWVDGTRTDQNLPTESAWFANTAAGLTNAPGGGSMTGVVPLTGSALWLTYFTPAGTPSTLGIGETIKITMVFTPSNVCTAPTTSRALRIGLYNFSDGGTRITADGVSTSGAGQNVKGYMLNMNFAQAFTTAPLQIQERTATTTTTLMSASADYTTLSTGGGATGDPGFTNGVQYTLEFSATRTGLDEVVISNRFFGPNLDISHTATDFLGATFAFDAFAIRPARADSSAETFTITRFNVEGPGGTVIAPAIVTEPEDVTRTLGQFASFSVAASGSAPLSYQWYFNTNTLLTGATNSALILPNVQPANAGGYSVIVTNSQGSITSRVATLTVNPPSYTGLGLIMDDVWADGDRFSGPITPSNSIWYASAALSTTVGSMIATPDPATSRLWVGYFTDDPTTPVDLAVGRALKVTLVFTPSVVTTQNTSSLRLGLFNYADGGARLSADGFSGSAGNGTNVTGYMLAQNFGVTFGEAEPMDLYARTNMSDNGLMATSGSFENLGSGPAGSLNQLAFQNDTQYTLEFTVSRVSETSVSVTTKITGGSLNITTTQTDDTYLWRRFDSFAIRANRSYESAEQFTFTRFTVEVIEAAAPAFEITSVQRLNPDSLVLSWDSVSNRVYQIQSKDSLNAASWTTNATVTATGSSTSYTNTGLSGIGERYYRVVNTP
jgi:hypothetical protein